MTTNAEIWPPLLTPFRDDGSLDLEALAPMVEFYVREGVAGLLVTGLSGEPLAMSADERDQVVREVVRAAGGRIQIAAGVYPRDGNHADAIARVRDTGADIAVLLVSLVAAPQDDHATLLDRLRRITEESEGDLGLYEAPRPYKRLLATEAFAWAAGTGRFVFVKDTCQDLDRIVQRIAAVEGSRLKHYNAEVATFRASMAAGSNGFCGLMANVLPRAMAIAGSVADPAGDDIASILTVGDPALEQGYPGCAKLLLAQHEGLPLGSYVRKNGEAAKQLGTGLDALYKILHGKGLTGAADRARGLREGDG